MIFVFDNNDARLHEWCVQHPSWFVLNAPPVVALKRPAGTALLHRADCERLKPTGGVPTRASHQIVCAEDKEELDEWRMLNRPRAASAFCRYCAKRAARQPHYAAARDEAQALGRQIGRQLMTRAPVKIFMTGPGRPAMVEIHGEFVGTLDRDDEDGSYTLTVPILAADIR